MDVNNRHTVNVPAKFLFLLLQYEFNLFKLTVIKPFCRFLSAQACRFVNFQFSVVFRIFGFGGATIFRPDGDIVGGLIQEPSLSTIPYLPFAYAGPEL